MSLIVVDNRVQFSASKAPRHPARKNDTLFSADKKGTPAQRNLLDAPRVPGNASHGDLKNYPNYIYAEEQKQKAADEKAQMDWFNSSIRDAERASEGR